MLPIFTSQTPMEKVIPEPSMVVSAGPESRPCSPGSQPAQPHSSTSVLCLPVSADLSNDLVPSPADQGGRCRLPPQGGVCSGTDRPSPAGWTQAGFLSPSLSGHGQWGPEWAEPPPLPGIRKTERAGAGGSGLILLSRAPWEAESLHSAPQPQH